VVLANSSDGVAGGVGAACWRSGAEPGL